jgi:hypothetical protein
MLKEVAKLKAEAVKCPIKVVSERHNIPSKSLSKWGKDVDLQSASSLSKVRKKTKGRPIQNPEAVAFVLSRATEMRDQKLPVTGKNIAIQLQSKFKEKFGSSPLAETRKKVYRIFEQNDWVVRQVTNNEVTIT